MGSAFDGLIVGRLNVTRLLDSVYDEAGVVSALSVSHENDPLFTRQRTDKAEDAELAVSGTISLHGYTLQTRLHPTVQFIDDNRAPWLDLALAAALVLTALLSLLTHLWQRIYLARRALHQTETALQVSEDEVREHRAHLETAYNAAPFGICFLDLNYRYISINERLAAFNRVPAKDHIGRTLRELRPEAADQLETVLKYVAASGQPVENVELQAIDHTKQGQLRHWLCSYHPARDDQGRMVGFVVSILDITSLKEAESEKQTLADQLHQAQKTEALGRLTGGIAHDFNNMLGVILGTLEFVSDRVTDAALNPLIERIRKAAERAGDLTQRLLAFARQQPLNPRLVDVADVIGNLAKLLVRSIDETIDIRCVTTADLWKAEVDPSLLESALLNLAINARDAMPDGGKLTIEAGNVTLDEGYAAENYDVAPGDYVMVSVTDTGTGMPPEIAKKAFEPFFTTKEVGKGSGLGLSMVQGFIKQSHGHVKIYSELGQGTVVKLYIPRASAGAVEDERGGTEALARGSEVILVVEDDEMMRDTAVLLLGSLGYKTIVANSGVAALPIIESDTAIDLLFTDIVMPGGIDGAALAEKARALRPGLKVVYSSGYTDNAITHQGRLPQGTYLVQKPYRRADLARKIRDAIDTPL
ncbi:MAG: PAS domain-containing protein [Rhodospirillaceae bacterium]|nr:PAS domain-containing protein [Rhodospirillaceae bacterium]